MLISDCVDVGEWGRGLDRLCGPPTQGPEGAAGDRASRRQRLHAQRRERQSLRESAEHRPQSAL